MLDLVPLPADYPAWLTALKARIHDAQQRATLAVNRELVPWPDLDEDIRVDNLLSGARSGESQRSFKQWLASRAPGT